MGGTAKSLLDRIRKENGISPVTRPKSEEELLREEFPSLQDAWEQYQIVLKMVKSSKPKKDTTEDLLEKIRKRKANSIAVTPTQQRLKEIARKFSK